MTSLFLRATNVSSFSNTAPAYLMGKNGFNTELGTIPVLVSSMSKTDSDTNIQFTIRGLNDLVDTNTLPTHVHVLNNNVFSNVVQVSYRVRLRDTDLAPQQVAYVDPYSYVTSNVESFDLTTNTLKIKNVIASEDLFSKLPDPPFYLNVYQPLATNSFNDKAIYITGTTKQVINYFDITNATGTYTANLVHKPEDSSFINLYLDNRLQSSSVFDWDNRANISVTLDNSYVNLKITTTMYTVPIIEMGDNIFIAYNNVYSIANVSYISNTPKYNSVLSANSIYRVYLTDNLNINATSFSATNISPNPYGSIGNVLTTNNTFTLDYNENTYPGNFHLANNAVYKLVKGDPYVPLTLSTGRSIYNVPRGLVSIRAQNINSAGRKSPYTIKSIVVDELTLPSVENLAVTEKLYYDTSQGVVCRAIISFDHDSSSEILAYEISYKIEGETTGLSNYHTVQVPASGVDATNRINYIINNIERGRTSGVNYLVVKVTPINADLTGITKNIIHTVIGKSAIPANVQTFSYAQNSGLLTLFWTFARNSDGTLLDLDLQEVEIRRYRGAVDTSQYTTIWNLATQISKMAIPTELYVSNIDVYGDYTYLIKTRDTSRNESDTVMGFSINLTRPSSLNSYRSWSEDDPAANDAVAYMTNNNYAEYYWPSFANSDNGGFNYAVDDPITPGVGPSTLVENSNGFSSGFTVSVSANDLALSSNGYYQTSFRDIGTTVTGKISLDVNVTSILASTWLSMRENLVSYVSSVSPSSNVLWDSGSDIGTLLTSNGAVYDSINKTLISTDSYGNVYAIWNSGQFAGDVSNANCFALIAGVINANAIAIGAVYNAGGVLTTSNNFGNVTLKASSYQLVNLKQWGDPEGLGTWAGPDSAIGYNLEIRYSTDNVYYPVNNTNVNVSAITSGESFITYNNSELEFRWFQLKLNIFNYTPSLATAVLDKFRYSVDLQEKRYTTLINVVSNPTIVTFPQQNFKSNPVVVLTPIIDTPLRINNTIASYSSINSNTSQANITVYTNTGAFVSGVLVNMQLTGY
jgi:hypothetical protein